MARRAQSPKPGIGSDSFTDVVTNVVGILIVLVIVVGLRVRHAATESTAASAATFDSTALQEEANALSSQIDELVKSAGRGAAEYQLIDKESARLKDEIESRRKDEESRAIAAQTRRRRRNELETQADEAAAQLALLEREWAELDEQRPETISLRSYPTPVSRSVTGHETHFQLRSHRIAHIPLDELLASLKRDAVGQLAALRDVPEFSDVVGTLGGFRLEYTMERVEVPANRRTGMRGGSYAQLKEWTLIPVDAQLGETLDEALSSLSNFRRVVSRLDPRTETITFWLYPGSFGEFRRLRDELAQKGFAVAARPLPEGRPIAGSPDGTRSSAQ